MTALSAAPGPGVSTATAAISASIFNELLLHMHGPTTCLQSTMAAMVPFPSIAALPDADVLDLALTLTPALTHVRARYATQASVADATDFYRTALAGTDLTSLVGAANGADVHFEAQLPEGRFGTRIFDLGSDRTVIVQADTALPTPPSHLEALGNWHGLTAVLGEGTMTSAEVFTVAAGPVAPIQAVYATTYEFPHTGRDGLRHSTEAMLERCGWNAAEHFYDIIDFAGPLFDGELHLDGDSDRSTLTILGEFPLNPAEDD